MLRKWIFRSFLILACLYFLSYLFISYRAKRNSYSWDGKVWAFGGTRMRGHEYCISCPTFNPELIEEEERLCRFYFPLVKLDALLTKDKHIFREVISSCGL